VHSNELKVERDARGRGAASVMKERARRSKYQFGTMIEMPRAAVTADRSPSTPSSSRSAPTT
jgi:pyruvate,orthophosphate dikinase